MSGLSIDAVIEALQRQQGKPVDAVEIPADQPFEPPPSHPRHPTNHLASLPATFTPPPQFVDGPPPQVTETAEPSPARAGEDSRIKARFALTVLRVAQSSDQPTAARLIRGLARDLPHRNEQPDIANIHLRVIEVFSQLETSLAEGANFKQQQLWKNAIDAASEWLRSVNAL